MINITTPITRNELDDEFLRKLFLLGKTYGWSGDYVEVKDFIDYAFKMSGNISPTDAEYEPFDIKD